MISNNKQDIQALSDIIRQRIFDSIDEDTRSSIEHADNGGISPTSQEKANTETVEHDVEASENVHSNEAVPALVSVCDSEQRGSVDEDDGRLSWWQRIRILYLNKESIAAALYGASFYATYLSWIMFAVFILGRFVQNDIVSLIGIIGSMAAVFTSIVGDEFARKLDYSGRSWYGAAIIVAAIALLTCGVYGIATNDNEFITGGVLGMMALSFVPWILDSAGIPNRGEYVYVEHRQSSGGGYNVLADAFGIPQPQDPPPIEVSRDDNMDDEWMEYLTRNIEFSNVEVAPIYYASQEPIVVTVEKPTDDLGVSIPSDNTENDVEDGADKA